MIRSIHPDIAHISHREYHHLGEGIVVQFNLYSHHERTELALFCKHRGIEYKEVPVKMSMCTVTLDFEHVKADTCRDCDGTGWFYQIEGEECHCQK